MAYHPVLPADRPCQHCQHVFQAKDKRRLYCSSSCNTLACQARKTTKSPKSLQPASGTKADRQTLALSAQNVATLTVGAGVVAGLNYLANDRPAHAELMGMLTEIKAALAKLTGPSKAEKALDYLTQYIDAQRAGDPGLDQRMKKAQLQKEPSPKKEASVSSDINSLLRELRKERRRK
jgi:hypothetical protein